MSEQVADPDDVSEALLALDARTWARLLVALRSLHDDGVRLPPTVTELLALPGGELAVGAPRRELSAEIAADAMLRHQLRTAEATTESLRAALEGTTTERTGGVQQAPLGGGVGAARDGRRERHLRQELAQLRRQRDGAQARAAVAEARAAERDATAQAAEARLEDMAARLEAADEALVQAVARAERRSESRIAALQASLAAARAELERVTRRAEQDGAALVALRSQHAASAAQLEELQQAVQPEVEDDPDARPLQLPDDIHPDTTEAARWLLGAARMLFVDGYNVSLNLRAGQQLDAQRRWLLDRLRPLAAQGRIVPVVVFDGDQPSPSGSTSAGVEVRFTPASLTADDDIVFSVSVSEGSVLVVTDDRELRDRVRAEGANVIGGRTFLGALDT